MNKEIIKNEIIKKASEVINSKTDYIGGGMEGYAILSLIDDQGYPTSSAVTISKADGINWLSFITHIGREKAKRVAKSNKACVCLASREYNISLVGTAEIITDPSIKKDHWQNIFTENYNADSTNSEFAILRFNTERYNIYFASDNVEEKGEIV